MLLRKLFKRRSRPSKIAMLMYHRIASVNFDPWDLAVSAENFEDQLRLLQKKYTIISLRDLVAFLEGGEMPGNAVCLSFDDAYADNFDTAFTLLKKYQVPATFFVPDFFIEHQQVYWWDELAAIIFCDKAEALMHDPKIAAWRWPQEPPDETCREFIAAWEKLRLLPYTEVREVLDQLRAGKDGRINLQEFGQPMTTAALRTVAESGLVSIGLHTSTHPFLSTLAPEVQYSELQANMQWINQFPGAMPTVLAYPYGNYGADTNSVLQRLGIRFAFTTQASTIRRESAPDALGRFAVKDWSPDIFDAQLQQWFSN